MDTTAEKLINTGNIKAFETHAAFITAATGTTPFMAMVRIDETYNNIQTVYGYDGKGTITRLQRQGVPPGVPTSLTASVGTTQQVNLSWNAPTILGTGPITDYVVQYQLVGAGSWTTFSHTPIPNTPSIAVTGLTNGSAYNFQVAASNASATSGYSVPVTATPSQLPGTPTNLAGTSAANAQSVLTWTAPASGGAPITDYTVQYRTSAYNGNPVGSWTTWSHTASTATTQTVTGLTNEVPYDFQVAAVNSNGTGAYSAIATNVIPETFNFYISQVSGNDSNNGTSPSTPVLTLGKLQTLMNTYGTGAKAYALEAGYYYEDFVVTPNGCIFNANGSTIDASAVVPSNASSWTQPDSVNYPNVWATTWTAVNAIESGAIITVNDQLPLFTTSMASCNSTPFSYYVASSSFGLPGANPFILYLNSNTTNPNTDGNVYKIMTRSDSVDMQTNCIVRNVITRSQIGNNGSTSVEENASITNSLFAFGHKHNMYIGSGYLTDCLTFGADGFNGCGPFIYNNGLSTPTYSGLLTRCGFSDSMYRGTYAATVPVYSHGAGTTPYITMDMEACWFVNSFGSANPLAQTIIANNCYSNTLSAICGNTPTTSVTIANYLFNRISNTQVVISIVGGTTSITNAAYYLGAATGGQQILELYNPMTSFTMSNATLYGGSVPGWVNAQTSGAINLSYNVFAYDPNYRQSVIVNSGQTYTADYNVFYRNHATYSDYFTGIYNGTTYTTLASWQAATGQDTHSVYLTLAQYNNFFLGNPANGDFRINPNAQVTGSDGTVYTGTFPDGTPITQAGVQQHYNPNSRAVVSGAPTAWWNVPQSYADCKTYISNPMAWSF